MAADSATGCGGGEKSVASRRSDGGCARQGRFESCPAAV